MIIKSEIWRRTAVLCVMLALTATARAALFLDFPNDSQHSKAAIAAAIANVPADIGLVHDADGRTDDIQIWNYTTLVYQGPFNISTTLDRIRHGEWMSLHSNDGAFFNLFPNELPNIPRKGNNYYFEFIVWPDIDVAAGTYDTTTHPFQSAMNFPGPMRILLGSGGEVYFTGDHYGQGPLALPAYYVNPTSAPEPASIVLSGAGGIIVLSMRRRRSLAA